MPPGFAQSLIADSLSPGHPCYAHEPHRAAVKNGLCSARACRLQSARTTKYVKGLVGFLAHFMCLRGPRAVLDSMDALQVTLRPLPSPTHARTHAC